MNNHEMIQSLGITFISKENLAWTLILKFSIEVVWMYEFYHACMLKWQKVVLDPPGRGKTKYHAYSQEEKMSMYDNQSSEYSIPEVVKKMTMEI